MKRATFQYSLKVDVCMDDSVVRVVVEHTPELFAILGLCKLDECLPMLILQDRAFYRARSTPHWVLYKATISGWGAAPDPTDTRPIFDPAQR